MNLVNVGYKSVNCYALEIDRGYLLIDVGMPGTFKEFTAVLKRFTIDVGQIRFLLVTHFHPDHCGIAQELKDAGAVLVLADVQQAKLAHLNRALEPFPDFTQISEQGNIYLPVNDAARFKQATGVAGVLLHTPGHSEDSISIAIDGLGVFIGDLHFPEHSVESVRHIVIASWEKVKGTGETLIYPGHGEPFRL